MQNPALLKGTLQTMVLKVLCDRGRMYGYEITQYVKAISDGEILLTEGALYPTLHKLEAEGFLQTESVMTGKRLRKYYTLTPAGNSDVRERLAEFADFVRVMTCVLSDPPIAGSSRA